MEIFDAALQAGFTPDQAVTMTAIALAESGGNTDALNSTGEHSVGLWQINTAVRVMVSSPSGPVRRPRSPRSWAASRRKPGRWR